MKNSEITIVTSFFDIGRKDYGAYSRTNKKYVDDFKFWARIKNNLVVYTDKYMAKEVKKIRKEFGLEDKTTIVVINDIKKIEPNILKRMEEIQESDYFKNYRYYEDIAENKALYNYVMLLKSWCVMDAVERGLANNLVAWMDFGYNHGGDVFTNPLDFDFEWKYSFDKNKITYFTVNDITEKPIFYMVQSFDVYIMGAPFIVPSKLASEHYKLIRNSLESLLDVGFMDDDQVLMIMSYRKNPKLFNIVKSDWFLPIKEYGGKHLTCKDKTEKRLNVIEKLLNKLRVVKRNYMYLKRFKNKFLKDHLD